MNEKIEISVVVPCYMEEASIHALAERLSTVLDPWKGKAEIILVDDGSRDATWQAICDVDVGEIQFLGRKLSANRGHQYALSAGLEAARGDRILMLDADLQDPPELLSEMMAMMDRGYDVVYGKRRSRQGETGFKRLSSYLFYRLLNIFSDVAIPNDTGDFRLVSRRALDAVLNMPERTRFVRGMFAWVGFRQIGLEYDRAPRENGESKYSIGHMLRLASDAITSFSEYPLKLATRLALLTLALAFAVGVYVIVSLVAYNTAPGWASMLLVITFFSGIQLLTLGILGEYIGRLYVEAKGRPLYIVEEEVVLNRDRS